MKVKNILIIALLFSVLCGFSGCTKRNETEEIFFDKTHPLALAPDVSWAVVIEPYTPFHSESNRESSTLEYCRKGEILQVTGNAVEKDEIWYLFKNGWLSQKSVEVYSNRYKAETAAKKYETEKSKK